MELSLPTYNSIVAYTGDGVTTRWAFSFSGGYIAPEHVYVSVDGADPSPAVLDGLGTVVIDPAAPDGSLISISRTTPLNKPLVDFINGADISEPNLDALAKQAVFIAAEAVDRSTADINRSLAIPLGENVPPLPARAARKQTMLTFDANGDPSVGTAESLGINLAVTNAALAYKSANDRSRANHTGTQPTSTITGLDAALLSKASTAALAAVDAAKVTAASQHSVSVLDHGAAHLNDGTAALQAAVNTGKNVQIPRGVLLYISGTITGLKDNQRIYGGGTLKKIGDPAPMFSLPEGSSGVHFDGIEIDGNRGSYAIGSAGAGIIGNGVKSLRVTGCYIHDTIDSAIKLRDSARLTVSNSFIEGISENGVELRNYGYNVETGQPYASPVTFTGGHRFIDNTFSKVTRYEAPGGPIVDSCAITLDGAANLPIRDVVVKGNTFLDNLRSVFSENYGAGSEIEGLIIEGNTFRGGVSGGTAQGIYCKVQIGLVSAKNVVISSNTFKNPVNHNPEGTETAAIAISRSDVGTTAKNIAIYGNLIEDDTGSAGRMKYGVHALYGEEFRVFDNRITGFIEKDVFFYPGLVFKSFARGNKPVATADHTWSKPAIYSFARSDIPASSVADLWAQGEVGVDVRLLPCDAKVVGIAVRMSGGPGSSNFSIKTYIAGIEQPGVELTQADFGGGAQCRKLITAYDALLGAGGAQLFVKLVTDNLWPATNDIVVDIIVDLDP